MAPNVKSIFQKVLKEIVPSSSERRKLDAIINFAKSELHTELSENNVKAEIMVGGSVAKDTWLRGNHDIDIFVKFDLKYENQDIGKILGKSVKSVFKKVKILHGTRDYYNINFKGCILEIVPVLCIKHPKDAKNSMDASPFHVNYVRKKIGENPGLANEIRLLKSFAYSQNVYGAETFISCFSGYALELLMVNYKSFSKLIESWNNIQPKIFIDIEKHFKDSSEIEKTLSQPKLASPVVLIDPVLKERNVCSALDYNTFAKMIFAVRMFKHKPDISFFRQKPSLVKKLSSKRKTILVEYRIKPEMFGNDTYMAKIKSRLETVVTALQKSSILVYNYGFTEKSAFVEIETLKLSVFKKHKGPGVWINQEFFHKFMKKWPQTYVSGTDLVVDVKREFTDIKSFVLKILRRELNV